MNENANKQANEKAPITTLPGNYVPVYHLSVTDERQFLWLNIYAIGLLIPFILLMDVWARAVQVIRGPMVGTVPFPEILLWFGMILVFPLHEWLHGVVIQWVGHKPRYGMKTTDAGPIKIPYVLFATADGAFFRPGEFIAVAMTPVVVITLLGMLLMVLLPDNLLHPISWAVVINGSGAVGDIWMTIATLRQPSTALVQDEEDSITIIASQ